VGTDIEIRQRRAFLASPAPIFDEAFAGQKGRFPWQGLALQLVWQCLLEFFDPLKADGDLGVDDRIYQRCPTVERIRKLRLRPVTPAGVLGEKVEQHV
jgi:hypothetical protein